MRKLTAAISLISAFAASFAQQDAGARKNNDLGFRLYRAFSAKTSSSNFVFSPYSVYMTYAALYAAADGDTAAGIRAFMDFPASADAHGENSSAFYGRFKKNSGSGAAEMVAQNIFWVEDDIELEPDFRGRLKSKFDLPCISVDFERPKRALGIMNSTVAAASKNSVKNSVPPSCVTGRTVFIVQNACFFDGAFSLDFGRANTSKEPFAAPGGRRESVPMMHSESVEYNYVETDSFKAFKLPYKGDTMSLLILLPGKGVSPSEALLSLDAGKLAKMMKLLGSKECPVSSLSLPRFRLDCPPLSIGPVLKDLGLSAAFSLNADFGRISSILKGRPIDAYLHKAAFVVEEKSQNAPNVKAKSGMFGIPLRHSVVDRPFAFMLLDGATSAVYFMGHVVDPAKN